ncbi:MAG TPA: ATP-dependent helicase [Gemmatimonadaceae bacterium]|nr:ATP-dependent helicase [Gemmatimonadaceae bacterium]
MSDDLRTYAPRARDVAGAGGTGSGLNQEQQAAAVHGDGPLLIVAGAGTGKTRTLVHRVAYLLDQGVPAARILLLTFTRRSAQEMLARVERLVGSTSRQVHGGTFHGTGYRLLRRFGSRAGIANDLTILDQEDAVDLMHLSRAQLGYADKKKRFPKKETLHQVYSRHINTDIPIEDILAEDYPQFEEFCPDILRIFADYTQRKSQRNLVDYDDLLLFWAAMLDAPGIAEQVAGLYDHLLVDEYQDTNLLQARVLKGMCRTHANLTVVGDDAQSIYAFRGATIRNILDFPKTFSGASIVTLSQNYRSTQAILDTSNIAISRARERYTKDLWSDRGPGEKPWLVTAADEAAQTRFVVDRVMELHEDGVPLREIAVLFRAGYMSADLEIELTARGIPFEKWGGLKFLEAAHVKDVLAFLRILENPRDEVSWYRVLMLLPGVGETTARNAIAALAGAGWSHDAYASFVAPPRAREAHTTLVNLLDSMRRTPTHSEGAVADDIARVRGVYDAVLRERYDKAEPRLADLDQLQTIAAGFPDRAAFLAALALEPPQATSDLGDGATSDDDALVLSTAHSAKGREWDAVFVLWAVDGWFPLSRALNSEDEIDEERRLFYVALTRARNHLFVSYPLAVYDSRRSGDYALDQVSRFLDRGVRETMQRVVVEATDAPSAPDATASRSTIDLRAAVRARFGG